MIYNDVISVAQVGLRDRQGANWNKVADLLPLLEMMVQSVITILANQNPEMVWVSTSLSLNPTTGYGPYYVESGGTPIDFKYIARMESDQRTEIQRGSRASSDHAIAGGRPTRYWTESYGNTKIFFNISPDDTYVYPVWYVPIVSRNVSIDANIPLPPMFFETLVFWLIRLAGNIDEYITSAEESMISILTPVVNSILDARVSTLDVEVENLGF